MNQYPTLNMHGPNLPTSLAQLYEKQGRNGRGNYSESDILLRDHYAQCGNTHCNLARES